MTHQIRAARQGKSAYSRDIRDLTLLSDVPSHKILLEKHDTAQLDCDNGYWYKETIRHNLGYYPNFYIYYKDPDTGRWISPQGALSGYYAAGMQVTTNIIRFHLMYMLPMDLFNDCAPCPDITAAPYNLPAEEKYVEFRWLLIVDPLYKP